jgi:hypothetical protein
VDADGRDVHLIARIDKATGKVVVVRTGIYAVSHLCVNPDGDVWTLGHRIHQSSTDPAYPMLRLYSFEKGRLQGYLPNNSVPHGNKTGFFTPFGSISGFRTQDAIRHLPPQIASCTRSAVEVFSPETEEWMHLDVAAGRLDRWKIDSGAISASGANDSDGFAYLPPRSQQDGDGTAYLLASIKNHNVPQKSALFILRLRGEKRSWQDVSAQSGLDTLEGMTRIWGSDGQTLVHHARDRQLHWSQPNLDEVEKVKDNAVSQQ